MFGAMLVTNKGSVNGTRELRRKASGEIALCIVALVCDGSVTSKMDVFLIGIRYLDLAEKPCPSSIFPAWSIGQYKARLWRTMPLAQQTWQVSPKNHGAAAFAQLRSG